MTKVYIIGGGISGLAAAIHLSQYDQPCVIYEATTQLGGRCRSFFSDVLERDIDNGNHLLLGCNSNILNYCKIIGSMPSFVVPERAEYRFFDVKNNEVMHYRPGEAEGMMQAFKKKHRPPGASTMDMLWLALSRILPRSISVQGVLSRCSRTPREIIRLLVKSIFNTPPHAVPARRLWSIMQQGYDVEYGWRGYAVKHSLNESFIAPAKEYIAQKGNRVMFNQRLLNVQVNAGRVTELMFADEVVQVKPEDWVVLAVPWRIAARMLPSIKKPETYHTIVNGHFAYDAGQREMPYLGVLKGAADWLFFRPGIISSTTSAADDLAAQSDNTIAAHIWQDICTALAIDAPLPAYHIIKEKRATVCQDSEHDAMRPLMQQDLDNLLLCGDYIASDLPITLENAAQSARAAATHILRPKSSNALL